MEHAQRPDLRLAGTGCTACGTPIPLDAIDVRARRDELAFVELHCPACGTRAVGIASVDPEGTTLLDIRPRGELGPLDEARLAGGSPVGIDDLLEMHRLLADHTGDLLTLLDPAGAASR